MIRLKAAVKLPTQPGLILRASNTTLLLHPSVSHPDIEGTLVNLFCETSNCTGDVVHKAK